MSFRVFPDLKVWFVYNKTVPLEILHELSMDEDEVIRKRVADRRKLDEDLFWRLARDPGVSVRGTIAGNAKAPRLVLDLLTGDSNDWVSSKAKEALEQRFDVR